MVIQFKSIDCIYHKERTGLKPNTVREIDLNDERFLHLISKAYSGFDEGEITIKIVNAQTEDWFKRKVEDITIFKNLMIISWKHEDYSISTKNEVNSQDKLNNTDNKPLGVIGQETSTTTAVVSALKKPERVPDIHSQNKELMDKDYDEGSLAKKLKHDALEEKEVLR